ncbi:MAG TPA: hypothetical protein VGJ80_03270 [Gemmatimonadales bacterium]
MLYPALVLLQVAAAPPATDIYLADLRVTDGRVVIGVPVNVTTRPGYDNQPNFLPNGRAFLYTSVRDSQADIYRYDLDRAASVRLTATRESEYSPTPLPDGSGFSVVRVEADSTQRLWAFDEDGTHPHLVLDSITPVGYHAWAGAHTLVLFVLGTPPTLQITDTRTPSARGEIVAQNIGRSLQRVPRSAAIAFLQRDSVAGNWIKQVNPTTKDVIPLVRALDGADFFTWTPGGIALAARDTKLYQWNPRRSQDWEEIADVSAAGLTNVTRLAVNPKGDRLAIVAVPR